VAVILLNVAIYAYTARQGPLDIDAMVRFGGKVGPLIVDVGQFWRLLTANFLHRDVLHLVLNMFVLFNVGVALENAYRPLDFLALLLLSGLATMTVSLFLSEAISVGASGMVYGCLGGVMMFGLRYRSLLPPRYRRVLGAAIPTVLMFLWIGWTSSGVDNSAHLGGLLVGIASGLFLRPRLLLDRPVSRGRTLFRALAVAILAVAPIAAALLLRWMPPFRTERDDDLGISIQLPRDWRRGADRPGPVAYDNGLPGLGRASFSAEAIARDDFWDIAAQAQTFVRQSLRPQSLGPRVMRADFSPPVPARIGDRPSLRVEASFEDTSGVTRLVAYFVRRGELVYQIVFTHPAGFSRYGAVIDQMVERLGFVESRELREARARALLFPGAPWASAALGTALRQLGDPSAVEALRSAVRAQPTSALFQAQLGLALLQMGQLEEGCAFSAKAVRQAPADARALEADARCELARGNSNRALEVLRSARALAPVDDRLRQAEEALRRKLETPPR
jgi:membrane associated rhomboid family serine protease